MIYLDSNYVIYEEKKGRFIRIMLCPFLTLFEENGQFLRHVIYSQLAQVS